MLFKKEASSSRWCIQKCSPVLRYLGFFLIVLRSVWGRIQLVRIPVFVPLTQEQVFTFVKLW